MGSQISPAVLGRTVIAAVEIKRFALWRLTEAHLPEALCGRLFPEVLPTFQYLSGGCSSHSSE
jgi:hypothetical protein